MSVVEVYRLGGEEREPQGGFGTWVGTWVGVGRLTSRTLRVGKSVRCAAAGDVERKNFRDTRLNKDKILGNTEK